MSSKVNVQYIASSGNIYNLKTDGELKIKNANFHNYDWTPDVVQNRFGTSVSRFTREAITYAVTLYFYGSYAMCKSHIEAMHADFERDKINLSPGRLVWGDCYIDCYATSSSTYPGDGNAWVVNEVEFYCPYPFWIQEQSISIQPIGASPVGDREKKYNYQYYYAYGANQTSTTVNLDYYSDCDFRMVAYGSFSALYVTISGNVYNVQYPAAAAEYMVIDSRQNGIYKGQAYLVGNNGAITNVFDYRNPEYSLYEKIPAGTITIDYPRTYGLDITFFMERSEPILKTQKQTAATNEPVVATPIKIASQMITVTKEAASSWTQN